ncbi:hypothetical protein C8Q76DRAFT_617213 [Earliella scabrosa]|nr:hypothetical protein C8Q76DRAFT_617213 [Earliella scabrosa]
MHLLALNITDLILALLRATILCEPTDSKLSWIWAVLASKDVWAAHGLLVELAAQYLPGSFHRPPRNPADKISSGFKAWEWQLYVYGLLPGLLRHLMQGDNLERYYKHFCHLVAGARVAFQRAPHVDDLLPAHLHFLEFIEDLEHLYYQRRADRIHFIRPCVHLLGHIIPEIYRAGPGASYSQWTTENYIGNITREMKQDVTPYANLAERAARRAQLIALQAIFPTLDRTPPLNPPTAIACGEGYWIMPAMERTAHKIEVASEIQAIHRYLRTVGHTDIDPAWIPWFRKWARLRIPTGQIVRTAWKECDWEEKGRSVRRARMIKDTKDRFGEVQYFFQMQIRGVVKTFAMVTTFSAPDVEILRSSCNVLRACTFQRDSQVMVPVEDIAAGVAMVPLPLTETEKVLPNTAALERDRFFVVEKPGLDIAMLRGEWEDAHDEKEDADSD